MTADTLAAVIAILKDNGLAGSITGGLLLTSTQIGRVTMTAPIGTTYTLS